MMVSSSLPQDLILRQLKYALTPSPTVEDAMCVLQLFNPELKASPNLIKSPSERKKLWNKVKIQVHPDKLAGNKREGTALFVQLTAFIKKCDKLDFSVVDDKIKRRRLTRPKQSEYPNSFNIEDKWECFTKSLSRPFIIGWDGTVQNSASMCYNMRGQMFHWGFSQRYIGLIYKQYADEFESIQYPNDIICTETIKEEISRRGPVLCRSYAPPTGKTVGETEYPVIVGWTMHDVQGEAWRVRIPTLGDVVFEIPFSTCNIDHDLAIPVGDLSRTEWQPGAYLNRGPTADAEWRTMFRFETKLKLSAFMAFWESVGDKEKSAKGLIDEGCEFEVHPPGVLANSMRVTLTDFEFVDKTHVHVCGELL